MDIGNILIPSSDMALISMSDKVTQDGENTGFVNRKKELDELKSYMKEVTEGKGRLVLLKGEAGVGKSALANKFAEICGEHNFLTLKGRCLYFESTDPYIPFFEALKDFMEEDEEEMEDSGVGLFAQAASSTQTGGISMGLVGIGGRDDKEETLDISLSDRREMMFDKITDLIQDLSEKNPVLLIIDDFQWIDPASAQLLHHLARHTQSNSVFILAAYRPEELTREKEFPMEGALDRMKEERLVEEISVDRMDFMNSSAMVKNMLKSEELPQSFLLMLYRETEGNPYYTIEILNSMMEEGIIDPYSYNWDPEEELSDINIPPAIKDITSRRIERLTKKEKKVLMYAAVIGTEFSFEVLENTINIDVIELLDIIEELEVKGLIHEKEDDDEEVFRFNHIQIRLTLYSNMGKSRRRILHKQVGNSIEEIYEDELVEHHYALSRHFYEGKDYEKAYDYSIKSGDNALSSFAIEHAIEHYERALYSLRKIRGLEDKQEKEIVLLLKIGELAFEISDMDLGRDITEQLLELSREAGDKKTESKAHRLLGHILRDVQEYDEAGAHYEQSLKISEEQSDHVGIADCNRGLGYLHWREGAFDEAIEHYKKAESMAEEAGREDILALTYLDMGNTYAHRGENDRAIEHYQKSIPTFKKNNSFRELAKAYNNIGDQYMKKEKWDQAIECLDKTVEYAKKIGNNGFIGWGYFNKAEALARKGDTDKAEIFAERAESIMSNMNDLVGLSAVYQTMGIINRKRDKYEEALDKLWHGMSIIEDLDIPFTKAEMKYNVGLVYEKKGELDKAKMYLEDSCETFKRIGADQYLKKCESRLENLSEAS